VISHIRQESEFQGKLAEIGGLFKLQAAITWLLRLAIAGTAVDCVMLFVARFKAFTPPLWLLLAVPVGLALGGLVAGFLHRFPPQVIAARADRALSLKERLTTALELQRRELGGVLADAQIADAMWHVRRIEAWRTFPPRIPSREGKTIVAVLIVAAALVFIPNPGKAAIQRQAVVQAAIQAEAQKIDKVATDVKQNEDATGNRSFDQQTIDQILAELQKQLRQPQLSAEDALAKLQTAQQKLQANQDPNADALGEALQALAAQFDDQQLLKQVAQDIRSGDYSAAARDLQAVGQQASSLSQDQKDQLGASLRAAAAAQAKAGNSQLSDSLGQASDALNGSPAESSAAFKQAAGNLQNTGQRAQAQQNVNKALSQVQQSASNMADVAGADSGNSPSSFSGSNTGANPDDSMTDPNGSTDPNGQGQGPGQGQGQGDGQQGTGDGSGYGSQGGETVYTGSDGHYEGVPGQAGPNGQVQTSDDDSLADPAQNGANVPYEQVVGQYQQQASQAMDRASVPLSYRQIVKDYFSSLAPRR
jgi:inosine/xanthosine triphosphate pyrophosphatase family protein